MRLYLLLAGGLLLLVAAVIKETNDSYNDGYARGKTEGLNAFVRNETDRRLTTLEAKVKV